MVKERGSGGCLDSSGTSTLASRLRDLAYHIAFISLPSDGRTYLTSELRRDTRLHVSVL